MLLLLLLNIAFSFLALFSFSKTRTLLLILFFFFNDTATTEIYTLSLHDALPISQFSRSPFSADGACTRRESASRCGKTARSEEHTSELQSPCNLVCRLLLEKKKNYQRQPALICRVVSQHTSRGGTDTCTVV